MTDIHSPHQNPQRRKYQDSSTPQQNINPFFTNPPNREIECRCNPNPERSFLGSLRKYRNMQPKKKRKKELNVEKEKNGEESESKNATRKERERERVLFFFFFGGPLSILTYPE